MPDKYIKGITRTLPDGSKQCQLIDVTTHNDIDPGVAWAIRNPEEAEAYCRRLHPWKYFRVDLWAYLKEEWAKPLWGKPRCP